MKKWESELNGTFSKKLVKMAKTHEEMLKIFGHNGNANQNHIQIPPHYS
jgi:hypothetical protein